MKTGAYLIAATFIISLNCSNASAKDEATWIEFKGSAITTGSKVLLLDWEGKRGI